MCQTLGNKYLCLRKSELAQRLLLHVLSESDVVQRLGHPVSIQDFAETQGLVMHLRWEDVSEWGGTVRPLGAAADTHEGHHQTVGGIREASSILTMLFCRGSRPGAPRQRAFNLWGRSRPGS